MQIFNIIIGVLVVLMGLVFLIFNVDWRFPIGEDHMHYNRMAKGCSFSLLLIIIGLLIIFGFIGII